MGQALQSHHEEPTSTKERILLVAEELFAEKGFEGTRTRDIAERAEVNISTLHFHWKSKEELYSAVYQRVLLHWAKFAEEVFAYLEATPATNAHLEEAIQTVVDKLFAFFRSHKYAARLKTYWSLQPHALSAEVEQNEAGPLLMSIASRFRRWLPSEIARRTDVELGIMTINTLLKEYFVNPAAFGRFLGEKNPKEVENRLKKHVRQLMKRLYPLP